eukprot:gb/GECG01012780.1/.p1 GENE.gb/GECG01012780.1/~~gb/GECG01012780.1/.p1  ORF type:complete len:294 (+),score=26.71 gb/GECG01012780.1/:1-882(+)
MLRAARGPGVFQATILIGEVYESGDYGDAEEVMVRYSVFGIIMREGPQDGFIVDKDSTSTDNPDKIRGRLYQPWSDKIWFIPPSNATERFPELIMNPQSICGAGKVSNFNSNGTCESCSAYQFATASDSLCRPCSPGSVPNEEQSSCSECSADEFATTLDSQCRSSGEKGCLTSTTATPTVSRSPSQSMKPSGSRTSSLFMSPMSSNSTTIRPSETAISSDSPSSAHSPSSSRDPASSIKPSPDSPSSEQSESKLASGAGTTKVKRGRGRNPRTLPVRSTSCSGTKQEEPNEN